MKDLTKNSEKLSQFANVSLSKSGWETVIDACSLPKGNNFWRCFRNKCLIKKDKLYTLANFELLDNAYKDYCVTSAAYNKKSIQKKKAQAKARSVVLPHLVVEPYSGRVISYIYAIENRW